MLGDTKTYKLVRIGYGWGLAVALLVFLLYLPIAFGSTSSANTLSGDGFLCILSVGSLVFIAAMVVCFFSIRLINKWVLGSFYGFTFTLKESPPFFEGEEIKEKFPWVAFTLHSVLICLSTINVVVAFLLIFLVADFVLKSLL